MKFGQEISFSKVLKRRHKSNDGSFNAVNKHWVEYPYESKGIIIGVRTLFESSVNYSFDEPASCKNVNPLKALLVVCNMRENPVYVPVSELKQGGKK